MSCGKPITTKDLLPSERTLVGMMSAIGFGQIELLRLEKGEPVVTPPPTIVRTLKFGVDRYEPRSTAGSDFDLMREVADLFEYIRDVDVGEIRTLVVRHGLPISMEIELAGQVCGRAGGGHD